MEYRSSLFAGIILVLVNVFSASNGLENSIVASKSLEAVPRQLIVNCSSTSSAIYQCVKIEDCKASNKRRRGSRRFCKFDGKPTHVCCPQNSPSSRFDHHYDDWSDEEGSWEHSWEHGHKHFSNRFAHEHDYNDDVETFDNGDSDDLFDVDEPECGVLEAELRGKILGATVGGSPVQTAASTPWMAAIGQSTPDGEPQWFCGGALISRRIVITAAHCITKRNANLVRVGELDLNSNTEPAEPQDSEIESSVLHPDYKAPRHYHDIAIVRLKTPVRYSKYVRPICLPPNNGKLYENAPVILTGWGTVEYGGERSPVLQEVQINVISNLECNARYGAPSMVKSNARTLPRGIIDGQMCAGDVNGGRDACQGDSGGPIVFKEGRRRLVIGLVSSGLGCGSKFYPGIYTRVSYYSEWIRSFL